jgi:hypothetical protein
MFSTFLVWKKANSVSGITKHNPQLDVTFQGERCFAIDKINKNNIATEVKEQNLYKLVNDEEGKLHALMVSSRSNSTLWHQRHSHLSFLPY